VGGKRNPVVLCVLSRHVLGMLVKPTDSSQAANQPLLQRLDTVDVEPVPGPSPGCVSLAHLQALRDVWQMDNGECLLRVSDWTRAPFDLKRRFDERPECAKEKMQDPDLIADRQVRVTCSAARSIEAITRCTATASSKLGAVRVPSRRSCAIRP
jgi:hypothetical protein